MSLFSLKNVTFKNLIHYSSLTIHENKTTFICGKSGSGKSTLLKLLNATISPEEGEILYQGKSINEYDTIALRRDVMLVAQSVYLFDTTIRNNFEEFYSYRGLLTPSEEVMNLFLNICLSDFPLTNNCRDMSGGERQRIYIAICLSFHPKVLMLDEPTSALDEATAVSLLQNLKQYCNEHGITLIAITHDKALAKSYGDEYISLDSEVSCE